MNKTEPSPIQVCQDCLMVLANGENEYSTPEDEVIHAEGIGKRLEGYEVTLGWTDYPNGNPGCEHGGTADCFCDLLGFSWQQCDGCGSKLGGDRYAATIWSVSAFCDTVYDDRD